MYRPYIIYGLIVIVWFGYAQYHGWSLSSWDSTGSSGTHSGGWHWSWGGSSGSGGSWGGGGFHK